jgi:hypothetical protein
MVFVGLWEKGVPLDGNEVIKRDWRDSGLPRRPASPRLRRAPRNDGEGSNNGEEKNVGDAVRED